MEDANQCGLDRFAPLLSPGDRAIELHNVTEQPILPKDERIVSANPSWDAVVLGASGNAEEQPATSETSGGLTTLHRLNSYPPLEHGYYYGGYNNSSSNWNEHSNYVNARNLHVMPQAMYNDNSSIFHPSYGFDSQLAYGQFPPIARPLMFDGQLFPPHQMPVTPPYYPSPVSSGPPHVTSALPASQTEFLPPGSSSQENPTDNAVFGPGSSYNIPFGSFGEGNLSGNSGLGLYKLPGQLVSSETLPSRSNSLDTSKFMPPLTSGSVGPQPIGMLRAYEQNVAQGFGLTSNSSAGNFSHGSSYQSFIGHNANQVRFAMDRDGRRERHRATVSIPTDALGMPSNRNRGPRALKPKSKSSTEERSLSGIRDVESTSSSGLQTNHFNLLEFVTDYEHANFFVIKSFSEDNIHKSIKYSVWTSTPLGNRKLDAAYHEAKEMEGHCPVFLFFSVNASGQFCGVAEMVGPVDFENDADYWHQDRWNGQFPIKWHIIKDVPNSCFRHILLENNDNKPVTHSRDSQEVRLEQGIEMLKIFKSHDAETSLLEDFDFYDAQEKFLERKAKERASTTGNTTATLSTESLDHLSDNLADTLHLDGGNNISSSGLV